MCGYAARDYFTNMLKGASNRFAFDNLDDNLKVEIEERLILALPQGNENAGSDEGCAINCPVCGSVNILDERNQDFKCLYCESPLF